MDFRGRLYPIPPHLNHMGNDVCRGLLEFSEGKRLGKRGLYWLKVHLGNKLGFDKLSFDDRVLKVDENMAKITATIEDPLGDTWWMDEEDPWQALAIMQELVEAYQLSNPEDYLRWPLISVICQSIRTEHVMDYSTMLPWEETSRAPGKSTS